MPGSNSRLTSPLSPTCTMQVGLAFRCTWPLQVTNYAVLGLGPSVAVLTGECCDSEGGDTRALTLRIEVIRA